MSAEPSHAFVRSSNVEGAAEGDIVVGLLVAIHHVASNLRVYQARIDGIDADTASVGGVTSSDAGEAHSFRILVRQPKPEREKRIAEIVCGVGGLRCHRGHVARQIVG